MPTTELNRNSQTWPRIAGSLDRRKTLHQHVIEILQRLPEPNRSKENEPNAAGHKNE